MTRQFTQQLRDFDDADLTVFQFRLMMHYWRRGYCWEPLRTTAECCKMSLGKASEARQWLLNNGWVRWEVDPKTNKVSIVVCSQDEQTQQLDCSQDEQRSPHEQECSPHEQNMVEDVHDMNALYKEVNEPQELNEQIEMNKEPAPKKKRQKQELTFTIPVNLNIATFLSAWEDYVTHRREIKKPLTPLAAKKQLKQLEGWGPDRAVVAINHSIAKGWQSIYEPKNFDMPQNGNHTGNGTAVHHALKTREIKQVQGEF